MSLVLSWLVCVVALLFMSFVDTVFLSRYPAGRVHYFGGLVLAGVFMTIPAAAFFWFRHQIQSGQRAVAVGISYGAGLGSAPLLMTVVAIFQAEAIVALGSFGISVGLVILFALLAYVAWLIARRMPDRVVFQDGTLCPGCAYCIIGVSDSTCPECGRRFSQGELSTAGPSSAPPGSGLVWK